MIDVDNMTWTRGPRLGTGGYGSVYLAEATETATGRRVFMAVKSAEVDHALSLFKEKEWMMVGTNFRDCPQILRCYGCDVTREKGKQIYNLFLHYCPGGSVHSLIKKTGFDAVTGLCLPEETAGKYAKSALLGLKFIHDAGFVHRDIKPDNLLIDSDGDIKIADFGLAKKLKFVSEASKRCKNRKGTLRYMAPEALKEHLCWKGVDIWALGCTVAEMIAGEPLFGGCCEDAVFAKICGLHGVPGIDRDAVMSNTAVDFLKKCLFVDPNERWTVEMLLQHPFITR